MVAFFGYAPDEGMWGIDWNFTSPLGGAGPFEVTQPNPLWPQRMVTVPNAAHDVPNGTAVYLYGEPEQPIVWPTTDLQITSETNYDSSQMLAQLYVQHDTGLSELLWTEPRSGPHTGGGSVLLPGQTLLPSDTIYFRVTAVPEPCSFAVLAASCCGLLGGRKLHWR